MNPTVAAVRAGVQRGLIELRNTFTNAQDLWNYFFPTAVLLVAMFFMRGSTVPGTDFSLGARTLPSALGMGARLRRPARPRLSSSSSSGRTAPCCGPRRPRTGCSATWSARSS